MGTKRALGALLTVGVIAAAAAVLGISAAPARAASCPPPPPPLYPFTPWGDANPYVLTTGGSFEPGTPAWSLSGNAAVVGDNAPNRLDPWSASHALYLPAGSSATSACVTAPK